MADQRGAASPLPSAQDRNTEIALDLDVVSAACPGCRLLLVERDAPFDAA